jgi:hypothetical protein
MIPKVVSKEIDADVARDVSKLAAQVTESFYAEIKAHAFGLAPSKLPIGEFSLEKQPHHEVRTAEGVEGLVAALEPPSRAAE